MSALTVSVLLIPLAVFLILFLAFSAFNVYHLFHYGFRSRGLFLVLVIYICGTVLMMGGGYVFLGAFNWNHPLGVGDAVRSFDGRDIFESFEESINIESYLKSEPL